VFDDARLTKLDKHASLTVSSAVDCWMLQYNDLYLKDSRVGRTGGCKMKNTIALFGASLSLFLMPISARAVTCEGLPLVAPLSDSIQVGTTPTFCSDEVVETESNVAVNDHFTEPGQNVTGVRVILLTDPGTSDISDIVTATIETLPDQPGMFNLDVELASDPETPLTFAGPVVESIPETGAVQNLGPAFTDAFDLDTSLPAVNVMSDLDSVPEPTTWALMLVGFVGLGFAAFRRSGRLNPTA
jgi:hypothetical protein